MKPYYADNLVTLYHGDCREVLPCLPKADLVLTDPPYGVEFRGATWDKEIPPIIFDIVSTNKALVITGTLTIWEYPRPDWVLCWARPASNSRSKVGGFSHWSPILAYGSFKFPTDYRSWHAIQFAYPPSFEHPTPKPEPLLKWLIGYGSEVTDTILDPFTGSGTTLKAAKELGRRAIGIEIEEKYCEIAARRLEIAQPALFTAPTKERQEQASCFQ